MKFNYYTYIKITFMIINLHNLIYNLNLNKNYCRRKTTFVGSDVGAFSRHVG